MWLRPFHVSDSDRWDEHVNNSINGTFLQTRRYLSYHGDRFEDLSLMIFADKGDDELVAVIPLAVVDGEAVSHPGITHAGLIVRDPVGIVTTTEIVELIRDDLRNRGLTSLVYAPVPAYLHRLPWEADRYGLRAAGAEQVAWIPNSILDLGHQQLRRRNYRRKARKAGCKTSATQLMSPTAYGLLVSILESRYGAHPVHTFEEITELGLRFPDQIQAYETTCDSQVVCGLLTYRFNHVTHLQYIFSSERGYAVNALDDTVGFVVTESMANEGLLSFGISTDSFGHNLNRGLARFKEEFGSSTRLLEKYRLNL